MGNVTYMGERPLLKIQKAPTAAVNPFRFVGAQGDQVGVAGARPYGISADEATAQNVTDGRSIPVTVVGTAALELGDTVGDKAFVMSDNVGRGVPVTAGKKVGAFVPKGGAVGDIVEAFVFVLPDTVVSTFVADPTGGATTDAEARTTIGAILDILVAQGLMAAS